MIATLDERTELLGTVYCRDPAELFDVPGSIRYINTAATDDLDANAMTLVVRYLMEQGAC